MSSAQILVPRGGSWGRKVAADLRMLGADAVIAPLIEQAPPEDTAALTTAFDELRRGTFAWVTVTSAATVRVMTRWNAQVPAATAIAAVGPATADALSAAGYRVQLMPARDHSAKGLLDAWPVDAACARVLALGSANAHPTLPDGLRRIGCDVTVVHAYRTVGVQASDAVTAAVRAGQVRVILLTAGTVAAEVSRQFAPLPEDTLIVAIGEQTAADARGHGLRVDTVCADHSATALARAAVNLIDHGAAAPGPADEPSRAQEPSRADEPSRAPGLSAVKPRPGASAGPAARVAAAAASSLDDGTPVPLHEHRPPVAHPVIRPRRLRSSAAMRRLTAETRIHPAQLVLPMFVREGATQPAPIAAMPGVDQHSMDSLRRAAADAAAAGVGGVMLFGVPARRDATGTGATDPDGILNAATRAVVAEVGDALVVQTDLCLDEFTDHGHCGVLDDRGRVDNDATLVRYQDMALAQAEAGSQLLGLSGMMDGQVAAVRAALDDAGHLDTAILGYSAKYASAFYGPFREAVDSQLHGDRRTYQQDPANGREGLREAALDRAEGADVIMVKPAMSYLDVLAAVAAASDIPVWAYQVSGEYAMICAAAERGWIDRDRALREAVTGILRAGADAVLTYAAVELAREQV